MKKAIFALIFLCLALSVSAWWDTNWSYKQPITITDTNGTTRTNFQIFVNFNSLQLVSAGKLKSDCNDLRFTDSTETLDLNYWIESGCNTADTNVWVNVPTINGGTTTTINMYYGNLTALGKTDGNKTFLFFDNFERGANGDAIGAPWSIVLGDADISTTQAYSGTRSGKLIGGATTPYVRAVVNMADANIAIAARIYKSDTAGAVLLHGDGTYQIQTKCSNAEKIEYLNSSVAWVNTGVSCAATTWYLFELRDFSWGVPDYNIYYNNSLKTSISSVRASASSAQKLDFEDWNNTSAGMDFYIDDVRIRAYTTPNPTVSIGSEESYTGWLNGYPYRKKITIAGTADGLQTNYTMQLNVYRSSGTTAGNNVYLDTNCLADFNNIQFTKADGKTLLDYWKQTNTSAPAIFWVEFDSIPTSPAVTTFYIYYGNVLSNQSKSDGNSTFLFWDDFNAAAVDVNKWSSSGTISISKSTITLTASSTASASLVGLTSIFQGELQYLSNPRRCDYYTYQIWGTNTTTVGRSEFTISNASSNLYAYTWYNSNVTTTDKGAWTDNTPTTFMQRRKTGRVEFYRNGVSDANHTTNTPVGAGAVQFVTYYQDATHYDILDINWVFIRNWTTNEPTYSTWGSTEFNVAPDINIISPRGFDGNYLKGDVNAGITFNVIDRDNDELHVKLAYSTTAGLFTNTIIADLNLNNSNLANLSCQDRNWSDTTTCTYNWGVGLVDGNYFIDANVWDTRKAQDLNSTGLSFNVATPHGNWNTIGTLSNVVNGVYSYQGKLFMTGTFQDANGIGSADFIAYFNTDTNTWNTIGYSQSSGSTLYPMAEYKDKLFVSGSPSDINGISSADQIAFWDGNANRWGTIGVLGVLGAYAMTVYQGNLYIGGFFWDVNGIASADTIAVWKGDTNQWGTIGALQMATYVYGMTVYKEKLFVVGSFTDANGIGVADYLAFWDGNANRWGTIGGLNNQAYSLGVYNDELWVGGDFTDANGIGDCDKVCVYDMDTNSWHSVGGLNSYPDWFTIYRNKLVVTGNFTDGNAISACDYICLWDGSSWSSIGGVNSYIMMTAIHNDTLFIGGNFTDANLIGSADRIATWFEPTATVATYDFTVSLPSSCTGTQGKSTAGDGTCDRCWVQPDDSIPPIDSADLNCQGQNVGTTTSFLKITFAGTATQYDLNMDLNATPPTGLSALAKCDSGDSTGATTLSSTTQTICNNIVGDHNVFMWLKFTNYSVSSGLFNVRNADVNSGAP